MFLVFQVHLFDLVLLIRSQQFISYARIGLPGLNQYSKQ